MDQLDDWSNCAKKNTSKKHLVEARKRFWPRKGTFEFHFTFFPSFKLLNYFVTLLTFIEKKIFTIIITTTIISITITIITIFQTALETILSSCQHLLEKIVNAKVSINSREKRINDPLMKLNCFCAKKVCQLSQNHQCGTNVFSFFRGNISTLQPQFLTVNCEVHFVKVKMFRLSAHPHVINHELLLKCPSKGYGIWTKKIYMSL